MRGSNMDERIGVSAMILTLAAALLAANQGYAGMGFLLFIAAATPLPAMVETRACRWLRTGHAPSALINPRLS